MADAMDSKSIVRKGVWVRIPPPALSDRFFPTPDELTRGVVGLDNQCQGLIPGDEIVGRKEPPATERA